MNKRPEYVHCVLTGYHNDTNSWCGKDCSLGFHFTSPTHAILNARNQGRLLICKECSKKMKETLEQGTESHVYNAR